MSHWYTQTRVGNTAAGARLVIHRASGAIKGAHLLGVGADDIINVSLWRSVRAPTSATRAQ